MLAHHRPGFLELHILFFLVLVDLEHMVSSMRRNQAPNRILRQVVRVDSCEESIDVVGVRRHMSQRGILLVRIPPDGGLGICFHRGIMTTQQSKEFLRPRFAIKRGKCVRNLFGVRQNLLIGGLLDRKSVV